MTIGGSTRRVADGHNYHVRDQRMQRLPGDELWPVGERRSTGEQEYYASNLPPDVSLKKLPAASKVR
jgi:hypothetical protein